MDWIAGVRHVGYGVDGGSFVSPVRKWLWHTTEGKTVEGALSTYSQTHNIPHFTWDPSTGEIVQHIALNRAARALKNLSGGVQTNRDGVIQVEVIGYAVKPFTDGPLRCLEVLQGVWRRLGIPELFPAGPPLPYPRSYGAANGQRSTATWARAGHFGHSQVPENDHGDPGAIDPRRLFLATTPAPAPASAPAVPSSTAKELTVADAITYTAAVWIGDRGKGWIDVPAGPSNAVLGVCPQGSDPRRDAGPLHPDGYFPMFQVAAQPNAVEQPNYPQGITGPAGAPGKPVPVVTVTVSGAPPNAWATVLVAVA